MPWCPLLTMSTQSSHEKLSEKGTNSEDVVTAAQVVDVAIAGGGLAGLVTAAAVRRACPGVTVKVRGQMHLKNAATHVAVNRNYQV